MLINRILCEYKAENFEKLKKNEKNAQNHLTIVTESSIIGLTREREARAERKRQQSERLLSSLKESEMCLVTGPRGFLESQ